MKLIRIRILLIAAVVLFFLCIVTSSENIVQASQKKTIFIMGDSKSRYYSPEESPREGWVQELVLYLKGGRTSTVEVPGGYKLYRGVVRHKLSNLNIENWGESYATVKTFLDSRRFTGMLRQVRRNDYVIIALGHNGARRKNETLGNYKKNLIYCIKQIQKKGAKVVLITTPPRNFVNKKIFKINARKYYKATVKIAENHKLSCVDLNKECVDYFNFRDKKVCNSWYIKYKTGQNSKYPREIDDPTHFNQIGSRVLAKIVAVNIQNDTKNKYLSSQISIHSKRLFKLYTKSKKYKKKKYTKSTWKKLKRIQNKAWIVLYSPDSTDYQYIKTENSLNKAMKGLKKHG